MGQYFEVGVDGSIRASHLYRPFLVNPGFEVWQRGTSFVGVIDNIFLADMWKSHYDVGSAEASVSRESGANNVDSGVYSMKVVYAKSASGYFQVKQSIESSLISEIVKKGLKVNFRASIKSSVPIAVSITIYDGIGQTVSTFHTGNGYFQELSVSRLISAVASEITVSIKFAASGTYYVDSASLTLGEQSNTYSILSPKDSDQLAQRYYEIGSGRVRGVGMVDGGNRRITVPISFNVVKASVPNVTLTPGITYGSPGAVTATAQDVTVQGFSAEISDTTGGSGANGFGLDFTWVAEAP
jgi:hypothetical protein